jgi:hypothetical protein
MAQLVIDMDEKTKDIGSTLQARLQEYVAIPCELADVKVTDVTPETTKPFTWIEEKKAKDQKAEPNSGKDDVEAGESADGSEVKSGLVTIDRYAREFTVDFAKCDEEKTSSV